MARPCNERKKGTMSFMTKLTVILSQLPYMRHNRMDFCGFMTFFNKNPKFRPQGKKSPQLFCQIILQEIRHRKTATGPF